MKSPSSPADTLGAYGAWLRKLRVVFQRNCTPRPVSSPRRTAHQGTDPYLKRKEGPLPIRHDLILNVKRDRPLFEARTELHSIDATTYDSPLRTIDEPRRQHNNHHRMITTTTQTNPPRQIIWISTEILQIT